MEDVGIDIDIETSVSINININIITKSIDRIFKIISLIHITIHTKTLTTAPTLASPPAALRRPAWGLYSNNIMISLYIKYNSPNKPKNKESSPQVAPPSPRFAISLGQYARQRPW